MTRVEQREKRRKEIMFSSLDIFIHKGYTAARVEDIARAAGMSMGLLFHYFESKEKLYEELVLLGRTGPEALLAGIKGDPLEFFRKAAREIIQHCKTRPFVAKMFVLMTQAQCNDAAPESVKILLAEIDTIALSAKKIRQGQRAGLIKNGNPSALATAFWGAMQGIAELIALAPGASIPDSEWIVDILRRRD